MENHYTKNPQLAPLFRSLPKSVQESILQSGTKVDTPEQLQTLCDQWSGKTPMNE